MTDSLQIKSNKQLKIKEVISLKTVCYAKKTNVGIVIAL